VIEVFTGLDEGLTGRIYKTRLVEFLTTLEVSHQWYNIVIIALYGRWRCLINACNGEQSRGLCVHIW